MAFSSIKDFVDAHTAGRTWTTTFLKTYTQASFTNWWVDMSLVAPQAQYYAGTPLAASTISANGIYHGEAVSPGAKHLTQVGIQSGFTQPVGTYLLLDYVLFYPFVDCGTSLPQTCTNVTTLPRYTDGEGLQVMAVATAPTAGGEVFTFTYVDSEGNAQTSPVQTCNVTATPISSIACGQITVDNAGPFLRLANGTKGVRRITGVTFSTPGSGLLALVIVKPLATLAVRESNTAAEINFVSQRAGAPRIYDGAYINFVHNVALSPLGTTLAGYASFAWST